MYICQLQQNRVDKRKTRFNGGLEQHGHDM